MFMHTHTSSPQTLEGTDSQSPGKEGEVAPALRITRPSLSSEADSLTAAADEDFARLAKARSNPDILRSTIDDQDIRG